MKVSNVSYFVTLTYRDDTLPFMVDDCYVDEPCLYKRHLQLHFKKLRKALEPRTVKYYAVGEYGDRSNPGRPHYHYILFYSGIYDRFKLMNIIKDSWDYGISQVLPVHGAQGYVTKYILKFDEREHPVKPFACISHGLGINYLSDQVIIYHRRNLQSFATKPGGFRLSLPRYYKDKIFSEYQRLLIKQRSDMYRREVEVKKLDCYDLKYRFKVNPYKQELVHYELKVYNAMNLYRQKKKL